MKKPVEVKNEHIDDQNLHHVDVYFTDDDMEEGKTACVVCRDTKKVIYFDNIYRNSTMVQEAIQEIMEDIEEEDERKLEEVNEYLENIDPSILPRDLFHGEVNPNALTKATADFYDSIEVTLCPNKTPISYERRLEELINLGMEKEEAMQEVRVPIELEVVYAPEQGLFAVESEAMECTDIFNPYDGIKMNEAE